MPNIYNIYRFNCHGIPGMPNIYNIYKLNCHGIPGMPNIYNIYKFGEICKYYKYLHFWNIYIQLPRDSANENYLSSFYIYKSI